MPNVINISNAEIQIIYSALDSFLENFSEYKDNLHNIKVTRPKKNGVKRQILYPVTENNNTVMARYNITNSDENTSNTHSCTFIKRKEHVYAIFHQNKQEGEYYHNEKVKMKYVAVFLYNDNQKKIEILYKTTTLPDKKKFMQFFPENACTFLHKSIYFEAPIRKSEKKKHKYIEFMYYDGLSLNHAFDIKKQERCFMLVSLLLLLAKPQANKIIHGDIKLDNICWISQSIAEKTTSFPLFIDIAGAHYASQSEESVKPVAFYTPGYIAPELFLPGKVLSPKKQVNVNVDNLHSALQSPLCLTLATDIFAMGQVLTKIQKTWENNYTIPLCLNTIVTSMLDANPRKRPDLAYIFGYTTEKNSNLNADASLFPDENLKELIQSYKQKIDTAYESLQKQREEELKKNYVRPLLSILEETIPPLNKLVCRKPVAPTLSKLYYLLICCWCNNKSLHHNPKRSSHYAQFSTGSSSENVSTCMDKVIEVPGTEKKLASHQFTFFNGAQKVYIEKETANKAMENNNIVYEPL